MPQCSAWNCTNRSDRIGPRGKAALPGKTYHKFPKNAERRCMWVTALQREDFEPSNYSVLCADHFEESCFDRTGQTTRLRENAIPTIFDFSPMQKKKLELGSCAATKKTSAQDQLVPPMSVTAEKGTGNAIVTTRSGLRKKRKCNPPTTQNTLPQDKLEDPSAAPDVCRSAVLAVRDGEPARDNNSQAEEAPHRNFSVTQSHGLQPPPPPTRNFLLQVRQSAAPDSGATADSAGTRLAAVQGAIHTEDMDSQSVIVHQKPFAHNEHAYTIVCRKENKWKHRKIRKKLKPGATRISSVQLQQLQDQLASSKSASLMGSAVGSGQYSLVQQNSVGAFNAQNHHVTAVDQSTTANSKLAGASSQAVFVEQNTTDDHSSSGSCSPPHSAPGSTRDPSQSMAAHHKSHVCQEHAYTVVSPQKMKQQLDLALDTMEWQKEKLKLSQRRCRYLQKQVDFLRQKVRQLQRK